VSFVLHFLLAASIFATVVFVWRRVERWTEGREIAAYAADEPDQFDSRDELAEHFESTKRALMDLIPAAPLCSPALRHWKEIEAGLSSDPEFIPAVDAALRDSNQT
jgi:hypothetical protein